VKLVNLIKSLKDVIFFSIRTTSSNLGIFQMSNTPAERRILHGAKAIARYIGDESLSVALRHHSDEWPVFLVGNVLCAFEASIDAALLEKEQRGIPPQRPMIRTVSPTPHKSRTVSHG
jgi:ectoine hydroxylase-related dioxygenase (phytanoyl-CoA dioxygenase family)